MKVNRTTWQQETGSEDLTASARKVVFKTMKSTKCETYCDRNFPARGNFVNESHRLINEATCYHTW